MERKLPVNVPKVLEALQMTELPPGRKYQKLAHLNRAEKALRRKLMNKQNSKLSRVRKREEVEDLKEAIQELLAENSQLRAENEFLRQRAQPLKDSAQKEKNVFVEVLDEGEQVADRDDTKKATRNTSEDVQLNVAHQGIHPRKEPSFWQMIDEKPKFEFHSHADRRSPSLMSLDFSINGNFLSGAGSPEYSREAHLSFGDVMGVGMGVPSSKSYQWNDIENVLTTNDSISGWIENDFDEIDDLLEDLRPSFDRNTGYY